MRPDEFVMVETLGPEALARHPVWKTFRPGDRAWILGWGVSPERLDAELERFGYCGPEPLFPVLECEPLPEVRELTVAATLRLASGPRLPGYLIEPHAFGVFAEGEFTFNRSLPEHSQRAAERLAARLGVAEVFPLAYRCAVAGPDGRPLEGVLAAPWRTAA